MQTLVRYNLQNVVIICYHQNKAGASPKKPLTHKQLKNILAVLSQWPSVDEKPKLNKPVSSFKKLKAILDDMTPDFIKSLAYRIVAGKPRGRQGEKAGKRHSSIGKNRKTTARPKAIKSRLLASKINRKKSSYWELLKMKHSKLNASKTINSKTKPGRTAAKAIGLRLWSSNKLSKVNSTGSSGRTESTDSGSEVPDGGSVRAKDHGKEGDSTVSHENETKLLGKEQEMGETNFTTQNGVSKIVFKKNNSIVSLIGSAGKLSGSGVPDEGSAEASTQVEDDVVEIVGQTNLSSYNTSSSYDNNATMATEQRNQSHGNALNISHVSQHDVHSGKQSTNGKWKSGNTTELFAKKTLLALAAGDKRSKISRVFNGHTVKPSLQLKDAGKKSKGSESTGKIMTKARDMLTKPREKMVNLKKDKSPGEKAVVKTLNERKTTGKIKTRAPATKRKVGMEKNFTLKVSKATAVVVAAKQKASQKAKSKQFTSDKPLTEIQIKGKTSSNKRSHKMFSKSKTKGTNASGEKAEKLKKANLVDLRVKQGKYTTGQKSRTAKMTHMSRKPQEESDTENLDDSNSLNQLISKGSHLSR